MFVYQKVVEEKINQAIERGEFSDLNGKGTPLDLDDNLYVPESLRLSFRILKNAGMTPSEVQVFKDIKKLQQKLKHSEDKNYKSLLIHQIALLRTKQGLR